MNKTIIVVFIFAISTTQASLLTPTKIYWNIPTNVCSENGTHIPLEDYGITFNSGQRFYGDKIATIYENNVGLYPHLIKINDSYNQFINGGLPQNVDIKKHLAKLTENINKLLPDKKYNGLAIIDVEQWRPLFSANWNKKSIYKEESIKNVIKQFPNITKKDSLRLAEEQFNEGALNFLVSTIKRCKLLRPMAIWGFYGFPMCDMNGYKRKGQYCYSDRNDKLTKFLKYADAIYPTSYIYGGHTYKNQKRYNKAVLKEAKRLNKLLQKLGNNKKEIIVFHKIDIYDEATKDKPTNFYDPYQLCISHGQCVAKGCEGIVIWSTSIDMLERCERIKKFVHLQFRPYIQMLNEIHETYKENNRNLTATKIESMCDKYLTLNSIKEWCNVEFYGEKCLSIENTSSIATW
uniref:Hyaluronidase n=1 Tax=Strongyloides papillosus TaxID=174720 RepID=A0A0N5BX04_STREA